MNPSFNHGRFLDARYKITAQVRLGDSSPTAADKIQCVLQYKLDQADSRFQQMKITEVAFAKATSWSYLVGWVELSLIQKNHKISAARLCFEGPAQDVDFLVTNVKLSQEIVQGPTDQVNIIKLVFLEATEFETKINQFDSKKFAYDVYPVLRWRSLRK